MAKALDIIADKDMAATDKVAKLTEIVNKARAAYGNEKAEITAPKIHTCDGMVDLRYVSADDKVAVAGNELRKIKTAAIEVVSATEGALLDKEIERLIAVNPVLANLAAASDSDYI